MARSTQNTNDLGRCRAVLEQDSTLMSVIAMSLSSRLAAGIGPGWPGVV